MQPAASRHHFERKQIPWNNVPAEAIVSARATSNANNDDDDVVGDLNMLLLVDGPGDRNAEVVVRQQHDNETNTAARDFCGILIIIFIIIFGCLSVSSG